MNTLINAIKTWVSDKTKADWSVNDETDPRYVKNKPFWTDDPVETVLVDNITLDDFYDADGYSDTSIPSTFVFEVGSTYTVIWDGATYECVSRVSEAGNTYLGNAGMYGGPGTDEPFCCILEGSDLWIATTDKGSRHTLSIIGMVGEIHKIDEKYLPKDVIAITEGNLSYETCVDVFNKRNKGGYVVTFNGQTCIDVQGWPGNGETRFYYCGESWDGQSMFILKTTVVFDGENVEDIITNDYKIPTDDHINSLIDAKLGAIENGS